MCSIWYNVTTVSTCNRYYKPNVDAMKISTFSALILLVVSNSSAQTPVRDLDLEWTSAIEAANQEYFAKVEKLRNEHISKLELARKEATTNDKLDDAIKLRDLIESHRLQLSKTELPEDKGKLSKEKQRLANVLRTSKWHCEDHPHFPKWAGKHLIFHENGTVVPASDPKSNMPGHRWAIIDGRNIATLFGDFLVIFRINEKENALDVYELANMMDFNTKRPSVHSASLARSPRDAKQ